jgi:hypothetical protein
MPTLLVSRHIAQLYGTQIATAYPGISVLLLPGDNETPFDESTLAKIDYAFFSLDVYPASSRSFFTTVRN